MNHRRPLRCCIRCHKVRPHMAKGLCIICYPNVRRPYVPTGGKPGRPPEAEVAGHLEDYAELRGWGLTIREAAERMQVPYRTAQRWEARRRAEVA